MRWTAPPRAAGRSELGFPFCLLGGGCTAHLRVLRRLRLRGVPSVCLGLDSPSWSGPGLGLTPLPGGRHTGCKAAEGAADGDEGPPRDVHGPRAQPVSAGAEAAGVRGSTQCLSPSRRGAAKRRRGDWGLWWAAAVRVLTERASSVGHSRRSMGVGRLGGVQVQVRSEAGGGPL